jgi:hypothetical protein
MEFNVASGKHSKVIDANSFDQAAQTFLLSLMTDGSKPKLGEIIHVTCTTTEAYLDSNDALLALEVNHMKVHDGEG